jgi:PIN domain nuclease of toxin-antitoxin system
VARSEQTEIVYLDTHVLLWLHDSLLDRLSGPAIESIERGRLYLSPMAELELQYLHEIGRFRPTAGEAVQVLGEDIGLRRSKFGFAEIAAAAASLSWTRDPFDRLIVAEAMCAGARLVSKDAAIRRHFPGTVW